jgi:hypothetical protein
MHVWRFLGLADAWEPAGLPYEGMFTAMELDLICMPVCRATSDWQWQPWARVHGLPVTAALAAAGRTGQMASFEGQLRPSPFSSRVASPPGLGQPAGQPLG